MSRDDIAQRLTEMLAAFDEFLADMHAALSKFDAAIALTKQRNKLIDGLPQVGLASTEVISDDGHDLPNSHY